MFGQHAKGVHLCHVCNHQPIQIFQLFISAINNKPFHLPMWEDMTKHYICAHTYLLAFLLHAKLGTVAGYSLPQPGYIFDAAGELSQWHPCIFLKIQTSMQITSFKLFIGQILYDAKHAWNPDSEECGEGQVVLLKIKGKIIGCTLIQDYVF
jgi:hypothetical protein